jgi:hypothetical protein
MPGFQLDSGMQSGWLEAEVTRRDNEGNVIGVEKLGVIAFNHKNPFKVAKWEKEHLGAVTEDTAIRCAKAAAPYAAAGVAALAGLGYMLLRR